MLNSKKPLIVLLGPTAAGKTKLSLELSKKFNCEIISGDSMQVYRGMDIGTAKATPEEREQVPHHLIDIRHPDEAFSVSEFQQLAAASIDQVHSGNKIPLIVGGTGLYIEAVCYQYEFSETSQDEVFRQQCEAYAEQRGNEALYERLVKLDPQTAERLHPNDRRRVIRALEVHHLTGEPMSQQRRGQPKESPYDLCLIGLHMERSLLYERIERRIDLMVKDGLISEVEALLAKGYNEHMVSMQGLGYKEIIQYLQGEYDWDTAMYMLKRNTRRFAKRQLSWFRHMNDVHWVDVTDTEKLGDHLMTIDGIITKKVLTR